MINYFNLLPCEIIEFIFMKLNLSDLINLRIVDKRFKEISEQIKIKQLILSDKNSLSWFYTNDSTYSERNVDEFCKFQNYAAIFQLVRHLKRLYIELYHFKFSFLNEFKLLEQLEMKPYDLEDDYKLSLDNLKIVFFHLSPYSTGFKLTLDTIKLFAFGLEQHSPKEDVVFNYPDKIQFLEIEFDNELSSLYEDYLKKFYNLEYLKFSNFYYYYPTDLNILFQFKNLKTLDLNIVSDSREYDLAEHENYIEVIQLLINAKENSKKSELEIYFEGVKLIDQDKFNQLEWSTDYDEFDDNLFKFQIKNYDLLNKCDNYKINYSNLIKSIKIIPPSFKNKFPSIEKVRADDYIDDENQFIKFLNDIQHLLELKLINCGLTKSFFYKLIDLVYLNDLKNLTIKEKKDLKLNFDFILNLKQLRYFKTNQIITNHIDLVYKLFNGNKNICQFKFKIDSKNYINVTQWIPRFRIESYYINDNFCKIENFSIKDLNNLDDVISKLKGVKF